MFLLELHELKLGPETTLGAVIESAELRTIEVVLNVARVPMIGDVEDRYADSTPVFLPAKWNPQPFRD